MLKLSLKLFLIGILNLPSFLVYAQSETGRVYSITYDNQNNFFAGTFDVGLLGSFDNGYTWNTLNNGVAFLPTYSIFVDNNDTIFRGGLAIFRSSDDGNTWTMVNNTYMPVWSFAQCPNNLLAAAVDIDGIWGSNDNGTSWHRLGSFNHTAPILAADSNNYIFVGTQFNGLYRSIDLGYNWIQTQLTSQKIYDIKVKSNNEILVGSETGLYHSLDNGNNWLLLNFHNENVHALSLDLNDNIFAGKDSILYLSNDQGYNWIEIGSFPTYIKVIVYTPNEKLLVGTNNSGLFISSDLGQNWTNAWNIVGIKDKSENHTLLPDYYELFQNHPNPFNPSTTIRFYISKSDFVNLSVYDIQGKKVFDLINKNYNKGTHSIIFNGNTLPSGIYIYKLKTKYYAAIKKMLLIK